MFAKEQKIDIENKKEEKLYITSDNLSIDNKNQTIEFLGNINAKQGQNYIQSQKLKIFYNEKENNIKQANNIKKIIAWGDVKIFYDNELAFTNQADYNLENLTFTLKGENTKVITKDGVVTGSEIVIDRKTNKVSVLSSENKKVEALITPPK